MFWRKDTTDDILELRQFVEGMKRGQTPPTNDSLLETLRQIHDRREAPMGSHDHKRMLLERLRREMRVRAGEAVEDAIRVPEFGHAPERRRFLEWAIAASLVVHVGLGVFLIERVRFDRSAIADEVASADTPRSQERVVMLPLVNSIVDRTQRPSLAQPSIGQSGRGHAAPDSAPVAPTASTVPMASAAPVGPPVAPGGSAPIVSGYAASGVEGQADRGLPDSAGPSLAGPPSGDALRPFSEVSPARVDRVDRETEQFDVAPKNLNTPTPIYTAKALEYQIKGSVWVSAVIASDGTVRDVQVVRSLGYGLDESAMDAVRRMKFTPATRRGMPVTVRIKIEVKFGIH
jgi:protein TonB